MYVLTFISQSHRRRSAAGKSATRIVILVLRAALFEYVYSFKKLLIAKKSCKVLQVNSITTNFPTLYDRVRPHSVKPTFAISSRYKA